MTSRASAGLARRAVQVEEQFIKSAALARTINPSGMSGLGCGIAVATVLAAWILLPPQSTPQPNETPKARAHRICADCGLTPVEIEKLIEIVRGSAKNLSAEQ